MLHVGQCGFKWFNSEPQKRQELRKEQKEAEDKKDYKTAQEKADEILESIKREKKKYSPS